MAERRVGFLFNHDQVHQVAHSLPIALALLARGGPVRPVLASTSPLLTAEIRRLAGRPLDIVELGLESRVSTGLDRLLGQLVPARKLLVYRDNLAFFRSLDALVVSERTSLILRSRYGLPLPVILADHGAGDRAIGFDPVTARFDHVLAAGPKIRDRLVADAGVDPARISITGYPKFDLFPPRGRSLPMQTNGRPTILYNPHVSPHLSSWYAQGRQVLDFFLHSDTYNLIFAPHVMLFHRPWTISIDRLRINRPGRIDPRVLAAPHIHVDLGSHSSTDMTYVDAADLYLGDVSSQVYEFLRTPRPCLFLDAHSTAWRGDPNYAHWSAGEVIDGAAPLPQALARATEQHALRYVDVQRSLFDYTFSRTDTPAPIRAAVAIERLVTGMQGGLLAANITA
ncbi:hypothetical protein Q5H91_09975 [Sphingomonas sp. KR1UV-12]|uniref:CDP-glycerol glycerophosphotransferase (TagB/SpsB family) n=1 Tax=Sphingomonas aurea TaxID=3063994 RepID=A0ABT9EKP9_9SPHN|nr:hypothetical protein [Sphingomonas sp. KR1UV-12]MDP1027540.1 hypothetical protein [Sphingomonas sp. KR1UV-12]